MSILQSIIGALSPRHYNQIHAKGWEYVAIQPAGRNWGGKRRTVDSVLDSISIFDDNNLLVIPCSQWREFLETHGDAFTSGQAFKWQGIDYKFPASFAKTTKRKLARRHDLWSESS